MPRLPENLAHQLMLNVKPELDTNPALGVMLRMQILAQQGLGGKKAPPSAKESPASLFDKFLHAIERVDAAMLGDAKQRRGALLGGKSGDSKGSTAAKPTKDAVYFDTGMADLRDLFEYFDLLLLTMGDKIPLDVRESLKQKKEEIFKKWHEAKSDPKLTLEFRDKLEEIKEALEKEKERCRARIAIPHSFTVPGDFDRQDKWALYCLKSTNKQGFFFLYRQGSAAWFKIFTWGNRLYPLNMPGIVTEQIITGFFGGCAYTYVGDEGLYSFLPAR